MERPCEKRPSRTEVHEPRGPCPRIRGSIEGERSQVGTLAGLLRLSELTAPVHSARRLTFIDGRIMHARWGEVGKAATGLGPDSRWRWLRTRGRFLSTLSHPTAGK